MDEYIKREDVLRAYEEEQRRPGPYRFETLIESVPSTDVAPVRHGRWIEKEKYTFGVMYDCSICNDRILDTGHLWNYCPNCGAKMDGGDGND